MEIEGAEWVACTPEWVARHNACGPAIRRMRLKVLGFTGIIGPEQYEAIGHDHMMANGSPVLWEDALAGQRDRLAMEASENAAFASEDEEPF